MEALKMEGQMDSWNDDRLSELNVRVDKGFAKVDQRFDRVEGEMKDGFAKVDRRFERVEGEMKEGFAKVDRRFERVEKEMKEGFAKTATKGELGEVKSEMRHLNERFDRLLHALMVGGVSFGITMLATLGGLVITQA